MNRGADYRSRNVRSTPTGPRAARHSTRWEERQHYSPARQPGNRQDADDGDNGPTSRKRRRTSATEDSYVDAHDGHQSREAEVAQIRQLQDLHLKEKLAHARTRDRVVQLQQVLRAVVSQLLEAKASSTDELGYSTDNCSNEDWTAMLYASMPSWISADLQGQCLPSPSAETAPAVSLEPVAETRTSLEAVSYFVSGSAEDRDLATFDQTHVAAHPHGAVLNAQELSALINGVEYQRSISATLWQATQHYILPAPVGKYGHPFCAGWLWENFDARRLYDRTRKDYLAVTTTEYSRLAREAVQIPFACRSMAQRHVVSTALKRKYLPLEGAVAEPDVLQFCKDNSTLLPHAIRRQFSCDHATGQVFAEWDALDLGVYILLKMAAPSKSKDKEARRSQHAQWLTAVRETAQWATAHLDEWWDGTLPQEFEHGARPYEGELKAHRDLFVHLQRCGLYYERLLEGPGGDAYGYLDRMARCNERSKQLQGEYAGAGMGNQRALREYVDGKMLYERVPEGNPVVRVKLTGDRVLELLKQPHKVVEYTVYTSV